MDQRGELLLDQEETRILEEELDKDAVCHRVYSTYTANASSRKLLKDLET
jgi:hypothetical protein